VVGACARLAAIVFHFPEAHHVVPRRGHDVVLRRVPC
jgi:hypothetical protein